MGTTIMFCDFLVDRFQQSMKKFKMQKRLPAVEDAEGVLTLFCVRQVGRCDGEVRGLCLC